MSAVEIGTIVDGVVTGITNFGAFVQLPDGKTGLCHISEIADSYVKSVADHLKESQPVKVKVISVDDKGKVSLSIRQAVERAEAPVEKKPVYADRGPSRGPSSAPSRGPSSAPSRGASSAPSYAPRGQSKPYNKSAQSNNRFEKRGESFEDMLSGFLKDSDDKLKTFKKAAKSSRKGNGHGKSK